jgi:hypothetical protein
LDEEGGEEREGRRREGKRRIERGERDGTVEVS